MDPDTVVITGGSGYVGFRLGCHLVENCGWQRVVLLDRHAPRGRLPDGLEFMYGDIRQKSDVEKALKGASLVFHVASYGMSGAEAMERDKIREVNINGTEHVIHACLTHGVPRIVYVSTYNVVFDSVSELHGETEASTHYVDPSNCHDTYSVTKALAEQAVLAADKQPFDKDAPRKPGGGPSVLRTCAIRPAGIYGPGEQRHIPRLIQHARAGLLQFIFGDPNSLVDWLHVDNLIQALVLAARALTAEARCVAGGQAYFISDDKPINNFVLLKAIMEGAGYGFPSLRLPYGLVWQVARLMEGASEAAHSIGGYELTPLLNRTEVAKCAVTHYFKMDKAKSQLGYKPEKFDLEEVGTWYKQHGYGPQPVATARRVMRYARLLLAALIAVGMLLALRLKHDPNTPAFDRRVLKSAEEILNEREL